MYCTECGQQVPVTARFCPGCGAPAAGVAHGIPTPAAASGQTVGDVIVARGQAVARATARSTSTGQRVSLGSAALALVLFVMPWADVSCAGGPVSGYDLATNGSTLLWLVPLTMALAVAIVYCTALSPNPATPTPFVHKLMIATGVLAAVSIVSAYAGALQDLKKDPFFGQLAGSMIRVRTAGYLSLLASLAVSVGGWLDLVNSPRRAALVEPPAQAPVAPPSGTIQ